MSRRQPGRWADRYEQRRTPASGRLAWPRGLTVWGEHMPTMRTRDDVLADIADYTRAATRLVCVDPDYAVTHEIINDLLGELEAL